MGRQYNKAEKRKRRARYLKRKAVAVRQKKTGKVAKPAESVAAA